MNSGIYTITNTVNGKLYVGWAVDFDRRFRAHETKLNAQQHKNKYLQAAWNKYGKENFKFEILEVWEEDYLDTMEHYWCNLLQVHNREIGYNQRPTNPYGKPRHSEETRKLLGGNKGKKWSEEVRIKNSGRKHTEEAKAKITKALYERKRSPETGKRISESQKGHSVSQETREKISKFWKNKRVLKSIIPKSVKVPIRLSDDHKQKLKWTDERKKAFSNSMKGNSRGSFNKGKISSSSIYLVTLNIDGTEYNRFTSIQSALLHFGKKGHSLNKLIKRAIENNQLYLGKYWKYESKDNWSTESKESILFNTTI